MLNVLFLIAFIALPVVIWRITGSLTWTVVGLSFGVGIAGNIVQSTIALGAAWNLQSLQWFTTAMMIVVAVIAWLFARGRQSVSTRAQVLGIVLPAVLIGLFLIAMRLMASGSPGPLSAVGYLINHPLAEDNAKWLNLSSQLAAGKDVAFNGYAGGPLLIVMSMMAAFISVLSMILLGGVNQVAVAANTVVGVQFLFIALAPFALAPLVERQIPWLGIRVPRSLVWLGAGVLAIACSVITSYGHLSLEFVLLVLVLWSLVFLMQVTDRAPLLTTLVVATTASVWLPLNVLGLALLAGCFVVFLKRRDWISFGLVIVTGIAVWDALISSTLFLLGINLGGSSGDVVSESAGAAGGSVSAPIPVDVASSLFTAPGGVEQIQPLVGGLALAAALVVAWSFSQSRGASLHGRKLAAVLPFAPVVGFGAYVFVVQVADAITTGRAPHYGGYKLTFALVIMVLASLLPVAIAVLEPTIASMSLFRWFTIGGVLLILMTDSILPRAISALSPTLWPSVNSSAPQYWSVAEVQNTGIQSISSLPVGCLLAPPESAIPTALPIGQESYACTRLLIGLNGLEGKAGTMPLWLQTDWMSNRSTWDDFYPSLLDSSTGIAGRNVITMNKDQVLTGLLPFDSLLARYRPVAKVN